MPFQKPWRNYAKGDLLYGLARNRSQLAQFMGIKQGDLCTIDQYGIMSDVNAPTLAKNKLTYDQEFIDALKESDKTRIILDTDLNDNAFWKANRNNAINIAKRKCKGGLDYIIHKTDHHIHFCLDGMDMVQVASKTYDGKAGGVADDPGKSSKAWNDKSRSITGAELRWVYRNQLDPQVQSRVQCWKKNDSMAPWADLWVQCEPPWKDSSRPSDVGAAWSAYRPSRVVNVVHAVRAAMGTYDQKIHWFFAHSDESKNAEAKLKAAVQTGNAQTVLALACHYLKATAATGATPAPPDSAGPALNVDSHLYKYLFTELSDGNIIA